MREKKYLELVDNLGLIKSEANRMKIAFTNFYLYRETNWGGQN